jgi:chromosome segregation ATPase
LLVRDILVNTLHHESCMEFLNKICDRQIEDPRKMNRSDPQQTKERLTKRIGTLKTKLARVKELYTDGDYSKVTYQEKKSAIQEEIEVLRQELGKLDDLYREITRIEIQRTGLLTVPYDKFDQFLQVRLKTDTFLTKGTERERRQEFYRSTGLKVRVGENTEIFLYIGGALLARATSTTHSTRSPTGTP